MSCDNPEDRDGLCRAHYEQQRRARAAGQPVRFKPLRTSPGDAGLDLHLRLDAELSERVEQAAGRVPVVEWVRGVLRRAVGLE